MSSSGSNRSKILQDLESVKVTFGYEYHSVTSTNDFFKQPTAPLIDAFKNTLEGISGNCIICKNIQDAITECKSIIENEPVYCSNEEIGKLLFENSIPFDSNNDFARTSKISVTSCEALSARTASVLVSSAQINGRRAIAAPEIHIVLAYENQIFPDLPQAIECIEKKYEKTFPSQITVITGPSRTADIEKTLVLGAHGPKKLYVLLIKNKGK